MRVLYAELFQFKGGTPHAKAHGYPGDVWVGHLTLGYPNDKKWNGVGYLQIMKNVVMIDSMRKPLSKVAAMTIMNRYISQYKARWPVDRVERTSQAIDDAEPRLGEPGHWY